MTPRVLSNVKSSAGNPSDLDGYDDLKPEDKEKVNKAWNGGKVAEEDIPESAKKPQSDDEEADDGKKTNGKRARAKRAAKDGDTHPAGNLFLTTKIAATDEGPIEPVPSASRSGGSSVSQHKRERSALSPPNAVSFSMEPIPIEYMVNMKMSSDYRRQAREVFQILEPNRSDAQIIYVMKLLQSDKNAETYVDFIRDSLRRAWVHEQIAEAGLE
jgi:hypothetical protein